jgi:OmpA-OmpF porin, OOP family
MQCSNLMARKYQSKIFYKDIVICLAIAFLTLESGSIANAQLSTKSKKAIELYTEADNYRVRGQFSQAIALLEEALEKDDRFLEAYYRLAIIYMSKKELSKAASLFEKGLSYTTDIKKQKVFWFDLAETYFNLGQYEKASRLINDFLNAETVNKQKIDKARQLQSNIEFAKKDQSVASAYKQKILSDTVNRYFMQYFPVLTADQKELIFTRREGFTDQFDEDLVISRKNASGQWGQPEGISSNINSMYNEGTCTVSADGRRLIFTSCTGREGFGSCDLYQSERIGNEWTEPENLGPNVNSAEWESQPSLSADGRILYFVSDRRGGLGRRDIWVSVLDQKGKWTRAKNVGKPVNTVYDEISPFIHVNNKTLFFASNGLVGYGGYDLYFCEKDSVWKEPVNIGAPINNHEDQFSLFITADGKKGYYSLEETGKPNTRSRIVEVEIPETNRIKFASNYVQGTVRDRETKAPLNATIEMIDIASNETASLVKSDSVTGEYLIVLTQGAEYALYVTRPGYLFKSLNFNYSEIKNFEPITLDIYLDKAKKGSVAVLQNIFFDFNKYTLKEKSRTELEKVTKFLKDNPTVRVEIGGHTDNVGTIVYNQQLSEKRAQAVNEFLKQNGIDPKRLIAKGYGQEKPVADNSTEDGRQLNRRIEFKLID